MNYEISLAPLRLSSLGAALGAGVILCACVVQPLPAPRYSPPPPRPVAVYSAPVQDEAVVSVYVDPPLVQPEPIAVQWAPPPMLVEVPPPQPYAEAIWTGRLLGVGRPLVLERRPLGAPAAPELRMGAAVLRAPRRCRRLRAGILVRAAGAVRAAAGRHQHHGGHRRAGRALRP